MDITAKKLSTILDEGLKNLGKYCYESNKTLLIYEKLKKDDDI